MMKVCHSVIALIILAWACVSPVEGQGAAPSSTEAGKQGSKIEVTFKESDNLTMVVLKPLLLTGADLNKLTLEAFSGYSGRTPTEEPPFVVFSIGSNSKKEWFGTNRGLVFVIDGERQSLGAMKRPRRFCAKIPRSGYGCAYWEEKLDMPIPYQTFSRIAKAKKVVGEVGVRQFSLKDSDLETLRDFAAHLAPPSAQRF